MQGFRDEDGKYLFDTQMDMFDSDEDVGGDIFEDGDDDGNELTRLVVSSSSWTTEFDVSHTVLYRHSSSCKDWYYS
jgi:hypothetical protein